MCKEVLYDILLNLHKYFVVMDLDWCLEILEGYGIVLLSLRLMDQYWYHLVMMARERIYCAPPLKGLC